MPTRSGITPQIATFSARHQAIASSRSFVPRRAAEMTTPRAPATAERYTAVVVLPTPPLRFVTTMFMPTLRLRDPRLERGRDGFAHGLELDAVEHVLEEAAHDHALCFRTREAAGHEIEELLAVDAAHRGAVRAAHVVRHGLE